MSQTLLEMAKDLVMAQIAAHRLSPDEMHQALQHTYASLKALQALEDGNGSVPAVTPETSPEPVNWKKSIHMLRDTFLPVDITRARQLEEKYHEACGNVSGVWSSP